MIDIKTAFQRCAAIPTCELGDELQETIPASQPREPEAPAAKRARPGAKTKKRAEPKPRSKKLNVMQEAMTMLMPEVIQDVMPEAIERVMQQWIEDGKPEVSMESNHRLKVPVPAPPTMTGATTWPSNAIRIMQSSSAA